MNYLTFAESLKEGIKILDTENDFNIKLVLEDSLDGEDCIHIQPKEEAEQIMTMRIHVEDMYRRYLKGTSIEEFLQEIETELFSDRRCRILEELKGLCDYESVKEKLCIRAVNSGEIDSSEKFISKKVGDIDLVVYYIIQSDESGMMTAKIPKMLLEKWKIDPEQVWENALENTEKVAEPRLFFLEKIFLEPDYTGEAFMDLPSDIKLRRNPALCVGTENRINGAVAVFYPGVARQLSSIMGGVDLYFAFTSIHEAMVHSAQDVKWTDVQEVLSHVIQETVSPEERLSGLVYHYSRETDSIKPMAA